MMLRLLLAVLCLVSCGLAAPRPVRVRARGDGRIIGGTGTDITSYPWMVSMQINGHHSCGGSAISSYWVLTAGHCLYGANIGTYSLRAGTTTRESGGVVTAVSYGVLHGNYDPNTIDYDISVLQAATPFPVGGFIQNVGLPAEGYDPPGGLAVTITGWGATATTGSAPVRMMKVDITVIDRASCVARFGVTDRMICAGEAGKSTCFGDSGGPLVSGSTQVGIVSWGREQCESDGAVYANVGNLRSWIRSTTGV
ncbi:trypsin alpha-4-like [Schistocerca serialis cubense]|uniref:trypsin alpha-4-like n=1 Tax=Schistocerca serialis cubense TaxID=2023355 RepID=UPI00214E4445|nr:trypsin alpha-4-like [Schistocerca serialis cubense]